LFVALALRAAWKAGDLDRLAALLAPAFLVLGVAATRAFPLEELHTYYFARYFHPVLPLAAVGVGLGVAELVRPAAATKRRAARQSHVRIVVAAGIGAAAIVLAVSLPAARSRYAGNTRNIEEMQVAAARWIARETDPSAIVAASDPGAVRFFGGRRVVDLMGLNAHRLVEERRAGRVPLGRVMREDAPTHLAVLAAWFPDLARGGRAREVFVGRAARYTIAAAGHDRFVVYEVLQR
jgi:hypothetical protein